MDDEDLFTKNVEIVKEEVKTPNNRQSKNNYSKSRKVARRNQK